MTRPRTLVLRVLRHYPYAMSESNVEQTTYSPDIAGIHLHIQAVENKLDMLIIALNTPSLRAMVEHSTKIQECLLNSCASTAKRLEHLSRYEPDSEGSGKTGEVTPEQIMGFFQAYAASKQ